MGLVVSEIICLIKIRTDDRQTDGNGRSIFSYSRSHATSEEKPKSCQSPAGFDYNISLASAREVKIGNTSHSVRKKSGPRREQTCDLYVIRTLF